MFKNFHGFHILDAYHKMRRVKKAQRDRLIKKCIQGAIVLIVTLLLWTAPTSFFGMEGLKIGRASV